MPPLYYPPPTGDEFYELLKYESGTTTESRVTLRSRVFRERLAEADKAAVERGRFHRSQAEITDDDVRHAILAMRADLATQPIRDNETAAGLNIVAAELSKIRFAIYALIVVALLSWVF
jgi:hypothetical protein